jgi:sugar phosphate isomerase/epimerase
MTTFRPILISTVQYDDELRAGRVGQVDVLWAAKRLGVDGAELRLDYWRDKTSEIPVVRRAVDELGLVATYATYLTLFGSDAEGPAALRQAIDDAVALGSPLLRVFPGLAPSDEDRQSWNAARDAVRYAASHGIVVALENFGQAPGCRVADIKRVLDRIESPALGTNVDVGNYASNGEDPALAVRSLGRRVVSTHLRDHAATLAGVDATYLGGGTLPLRLVLAEFARLPQKVIHIFEFAGGGDPEGRVAKSLAYLRMLE